MTVLVYRRERKELEHDERREHLPVSHLVDEKERARARNVKDAIEEV